MKMKRRTQTVYRFDAVGFDRFDPSPLCPPDGTLVVKVQPFGTPRNGTMGHCFIADAETGEFLGLVLLNSLTRVGKQAVTA